MSGLDLPTFTLVHTMLSLVAIAAGLIVVFGLVRSRALAGWTALYLASAVATSVTGFGFPSDHFLPSHYVGMVSLVLLLAAIVARYGFGLRGGWRWIYAVCTVLTVYLLVFVGIVQAFLKIALLHPLAPTGSEPPFAVAQGVILLMFLALTVAAAVKFRPVPAAAR